MWQKTYCVFCRYIKGRILENNEDAMEGSSSSGNSQRTVSGFGAKRGHDRLAKNNDGISDEDDVIGSRHPSQKLLLTKRRKGKVAYTAIFTPCS